MRLGKTRLLLGLFLFMSLLSLSAGAEGVIRTYGIQDGLRGRRVFQVDTDSEGFLWVFTQEGVARFDGSSFRPYRLDDPIHSRDQIQSSSRLIRGDDGNIWLSLRNGKVFRYDSRMDRFELKRDLSEDLPGVMLNHILPQADTLFLAATSDGLYQVGSSALKRIGMEGCEIHEIERAADGNLYLAGADGVWKTLSDGSGGVLLSGLPQDRYLHVYDTGDRVFIGSFSEGLWGYDPHNGECRQVEGVPPVPIRVILPLPDGHLLTGLDGAGVYRINPDLLVVENRLTEADGLSDNTVSDVCVDGDGTVWIATSTGGLNAFLPEGQSVRWLQEEGENNHVNVIYQDLDGDFWYGTNSGISLHRKDGSIRRFLKGGVVLSVAQNRRGDVYVGGFGMGLYRIDKTTGKAAPVPDAPLQYIYYIFPDGGKLWFGGLEGNFCCLDTATGSWQSYPFSCVGDIWEDGDRFLYLAGCSGLGHFDRETGEVEWIRDFGSFTLKYPVRCLFRSSDRTLWLATDGDGLIHYDPVSGDARRFTVENGLLSDSVISVHEDRAGRIWFTTEEGFFWLDPERQTAIDTGPLLGLDAGIFNPNAAWLNSDGQLSFGTSEGVLVFDPDRMDYFRPLRIRLMLTDLRRNYETVLPGDKMLPESLDRMSSLTLDHASNSFSISFSSFNFGSHFRVRYEYCLDGRDNRWTPASASGTAEYVQVDPGRYTFRLRAVDRYSGEVLARRDLPVRIRPPWYASPAAYAVYGLMALGLMAEWIRRRRRRKFENRVRDKMRSFVSVAHDLKTPVSLIKGPLGDLERRTDIPEDGREALGMASRNADRLMEMISRLLDLREQDDQETSRPEWRMTDLNSWMKERVAAFRPAAVQKGLELSLDCSESMPIVPIDRKKMASVVDNLLSNALKYTEKGTVDLLVKKEGRHWVMEIRDTGIGIPAREQAMLFSDSFRGSNVGEASGTGIGLMITRELVRSHKGRISFRSEEGKGTQFRLEFPLRFRHSLPLEEEEAIPASVTMSPPEQPPDRVTVLLVEDEPDMLAYLQSLLSDEYEVLTAPNGGAALEQVRSGNPDVVITDLVMPVLSGEELCRILKSSVETSHIPVIFLTAVSDRQSIVFGLEAGAIDYIVKPFDPPVLKARIRNLVSERERLRSWLQASGGTAETDLPDWGSRLDREFMEKVLSVLERDIANVDFSIADLCREVAMSRTAFYNKIKSLTGQGPNDYIRTFRLNRAKELLHQHRYSIQEVSDRVGFSDAKYFSICFKKQFGESPSKI